MVGELRLCSESTENTGKEMWMMLIYNDLLVRADLKSAFSKLCVAFRYVQGNMYMNKAKALSLSSKKAEPSPNTKDINLCESVQILLDLCSGLRKTRKSRNNSCFLCVS